MFVEQGAFLASVLGPLWNEFETNWDEAVALSKWTHVALSLLGRERLVEMALGRKIWRSCRPTLTAWKVSFERSRQG
jgi:hypothetical protein